MRWFAMTLFLETFPSCYSSYLEYQCRVIGVFTSGSELCELASLLLKPLWKGIVACQRLRMRNTYWAA